MSSCKFLLISRFTLCSRGLTYDYGSFIFSSTIGGHFQQNLMLTTNRPTVGFTQKLNHLNRMPLELLIQFRHNCPSSSMGIWRLSGAWIVQLPTTATRPKPHNLIFSRKGWFKLELTHSLKCIGKMEGSYLSGQGAAELLARRFRNPAFRSIASYGRIRYVQLLFKLRICNATTFNMFPGP